MRFSSSLNAFIWRDLLSATFKLTPVTWQFYKGVAPLRFWLRWNWNRVRRGWCRGVYDVEFHAEISSTANWSRRSRINDDGFHHCSTHDYGKWVWGCRPTLSSYREVSDAEGLFWDVIWCWVSVSDSASQQRRRQIRAVGEIVPDECHAVMRHC